MGILVNALVIVIGGLLGGKLQKQKEGEHHPTLGIGIMLISLVGFFENMYRVQGESLAAENLMAVLLAYFAGSRLGEALGLEDRISRLGTTRHASLHGFMDAALYFGVGGLQISGPIALAIHHDNSQLLLKSLVDVPFALAFGAAYGKMAALSALPVAAIQLVIAGTAHCLAPLFSQAMTAQICAMGYLILFFSGFNLVTEGKYRVHNINMLPGVLLVAAFHLLMGIMEGNL